MIDFGGTPEQKGRGNGPIPAKSIVKIKMTIREPSGSKVFEKHPLITKFSSGLLGLDCMFEVVTGTFENCKIYENWFLRPEFQAISLTKGQEGICRGSDAKMRAIIEASRGINPTDGSPAAIQARKINDWADFQGMEAPAKIGVDKPNAGDQYINNNIMRIVTIDREEYQTVMSGGEIISDIPIPEIPAAKNQTSDTKSGPAGGWGGGHQSQGQQTGNAQAQQQNQAQGGKPSWA